MTTFRDLLETFANPYEFEIEGGRGDVTTYVFNVDADVYKVYLNKRTMKGSVNLSGYEIVFDKNFSTAIDKSDNPFRVFATIYAIIKHHGAHKADYIEFSSKKSESSRAKLYLSLAKKLQKNLKWKAMETDDQFDEMYYIIYKKKI